jgi:DNA invertase Pin-like site-specific DNA recombinase
MATKQPMIIGYARVSTDDQTTDNQIPSLKAAGCTKVYKETASGGRWDRPELHKMLDQLREEDVVMVWKVDRLSRSLVDLLRILEKIDKAGAKFKSLTEPALDTTGPCGRLMMNMIGAVNQYEREIIHERTMAGLKRARAEGKIGGKKSTLTDAQRKQAIAWIDSGEKTQADVARFFDKKRSMINRMYRRAKEQEELRREAQERKASKRGKTAA